MLAINEDVDRVQMRAGSAMERNFVHDLPICLKTNASGHEPLTWGVIDSTITFGSDLPELAVKEGASQAHPIEDRRLALEDAFQRLCIIVHVCSSLNG